MTTSMPSTSPKIVFVDLDNPPPSIQLSIGDELAVVRTTAAGAPLLSAVDVPPSEFALAPNMFLMVPLALIRLPGQPAHTYLVHHDIAQTVGKGQITFSMSPANPSAPGGTNHTVPYSVV
jgi:hypothetical protein